MSKKLYEETNISDIADAIREKNGTQNTYTVAQMPSAVRAIHTSPDDIVIQPLTVDRNDVYPLPVGVDGFGPVTVDVPNINTIEAWVSADNFYFRDVNPIMAFGENTNNWWGSGSAGTHYLTLNFKEPKEITQVKFHNTYAYSSYHWSTGRVVFQGSNDGLNWTDLFDIQGMTDSEDNEYVEDIQNSNLFKYYRFVCYQNGSNWAGLGRIVCQCSESTGGSSAENASIFRWVIGSSTTCWGIIKKLNNDVIGQNGDNQNANIVLIGDLMTITFHGISQSVEVVASTDIKLRSYTTGRALGPAIMTEYDMETNDQQIFTMDNVYGGLYLEAEIN